MNIFVVAKWGGAARWAEDVVGDLRFAGHTVHAFAARDARLARALERLLLSEAIGAPRLARLRAMLRRARPDLILGVGAFEPVSAVIFRQLAAIPHRPPLVAWIGDNFAADSAPAANTFDLVAYTDSGLVERHDRLGFRSARAFVPLAANRAAAAPGAPLAERILRLAFVAAPTGNRRALLREVSQRVDLYGPGWGEGAVASPHAVDARLIGARELAGLYASHVGVLNIRNAGNVIDGLNQRHFAPALFGTPVLSDAQKDLPAAFDPGAEMLVYADAGELGELYGAVVRDPRWALSIGAAARRRVLAQHTYTHRLQTIAGLLAIRTPSP
jgi:spore maturation protein CgeB